MTSTVDGLPVLQEFEWDDDGSLMIAAIGFEDRATTILDYVCRVGKKPKALLLVDYQPSTGKNRKSDFEDIAAQLSDANVQYVTYNRADPESFHQCLPEHLNGMMQTVSNVVIDISAMSKMLILILLQGLRHFSGSVKILYTEAQNYGPSETEVAEQDESEVVPDFFVTSGIMNIATTSGLTSTAMPGCPQVLVAFAGFNRNQLSTLFNELSPQYFYLVECNPSHEKDAWRLKNSAALNRELFPPGESIRYSGRASLRDYHETINLLESLYHPWRNSHRFVVAPTGSKMQTVGIFLFKCIHPDVQVLYPTPVEYHSSYSRGATKSWSIQFTSFKGQLDFLDGIRRGDLTKVRRYFERKDQEEKGT